MYRLKWVRYESQKENGEVCLTFPRYSHVQVNGREKYNINSVHSVGICDLEEGLLQY